MGILGDQAAAAVFDNRADADEAWGFLAEGGVASTVVTDPGMLGAYSVSVVVDRSDLDQAQGLLASFMRDRLS